MGKEAWTITMKIILKFQRFCIFRIQSLYNLFFFRAACRIILAPIKTVPYRRISMHIVNLWFFCLFYISSELEEKKIWFLKLIYFSCWFAWIISVVYAVVLEPIGLLNIRQFISKGQSTWRIHPQFPLFVGRINIVSASCNSWHILG